MRGKRKRQEEPQRKKRVGSSLLLRVVILFLLLGMGWQLWHLQNMVAKAEAEHQRLSVEVDVKRQENAALEKDIAEGSTPEKMKELAREELGWVGPGEYVFYDVSN